jgi:hypothetical protein
LPKGSWPGKELSQPIAANKTTSQQVRTDFLHAAQIARALVIDRELIFPSDFLTANLGLAALSDPSEGGECSGGIEPLQEKNPQPLFGSCFKKLRRFA